MNEKQLNILLADDDSDDCYFFKEALKESTLTTHLTVVNDGEQLMQLLTNETTILPDVLFLDLNMPRKNGFECLAEIKRNEKLKQLPVIIYSTTFHKKIGDLLYKNGANYYIGKPSEIAQLKNVVRQTLTFIAEGNTSQPSSEKFVLTVDSTNSRRFFWFDHFFLMPVADKSYNHENQTAI